MGYLEKRLREPVSEEITASGAANAARTRLGPYRNSIEVFYTLSAANGDLIVEVSRTGDYSGEEHTHHSIQSASLTADGSEQHVDESTIGETEFEYARVYYTGNDSDITNMEASFK